MLHVAALPLFHGSLASWLCILTLPAHAAATTATVSRAQRSGTRRNLELHEVRSGADAPTPSRSDYLRREVVVHTEAPELSPEELGENSALDNGDDEPHLVLATPDNILPPDAEAIFKKAKAKLDAEKAKKAGKAPAPAPAPAPRPPLERKLSTEVRSERPETTWRSYMERAAEWDSGERSVGAVSGEGSEASAVKPFIDFFSGWLRQHNITSLVEASTGHWPSGWQTSMPWPSLDYKGVDILPEMVRDNNRLMERADTGKYGLRSALFEVGDMLAEPLPSADVLLTKDTLIHFPNRDVKHFLDRSVMVCPPRFKYALFVHDQEEPAGANWRENNKDIPALGRFHALDLGSEPFSLPTETIFWWNANRRKAVQLLDLRGPEGPCAQEAGRMTV